MLRRRGTHTDILLAEKNGDHVLSISIELTLNDNFL